MTKTSTKSASERLSFKVVTPSYRFMDFVPLFTSAGFEEAARAGTRRHVVRLAPATRRAPP